jgi:hypothetical protein
LRTLFGRISHWENSVCYRSHVQNNRSLWLAGYANTGQLPHGTSSQTNSAARPDDFAQILLVKISAPRKDIAARERGYRVNKLAIAFIAASLSGLGISAGRRICVLQPKATATCIPMTKATG